MSDTSVTVNSVRAGGGKTWPVAHGPQAYGVNLSIFSRITNLVDNDDTQAVLIVVPSILIQNQYHQSIENWRLDHSPMTTVKMINRDNIEDNSPSVQYEIHQALNRRDNVVIITHAAFRDLQASTRQREHYHLIIDEALDPFREIALWQDGPCNIDFRWRDNGKICFDIDEVNWPRIDFTGLHNHTFADSETLRDLVNINWVTRINYEGWERFIATEVGERRRVSVIQELRTDIFWHWRSIWIAAANFEETFMSDWMLKHNQTYKIHPKCQFEAHTTPITVYAADNLKLSRNIRDKNPNILTEYQQQVKALLNDEPLLVLRNKNQTELFDNEQLLPHNSAGLNNYREYTNISIESALNPTPDFMSYLAAVYPETYGDPKQDRVFKRRGLYTFYQTLMRTCLRDQKPAQVFTLDNRLVAGLYEYFEYVNWQPLDNYNIVQKPTGRPQGSGLKTNLGRAMTNAEKTYLSRKRRDPQYSGMSDDDLLAMRNK